MNPVAIKLQLELLQTSITKKTEELERSINGLASSLNDILQQDPEEVEKLLPLWFDSLNHMGKNLNRLAQTIESLSDKTCLSTEKEFNQRPGWDPLGQIEFEGETLYLLKGHYMEGDATAIIAECEDGERYATITVNIPEAAIPEGCIIAKHYSENEAIYQHLVEIGFLIPVRVSIPTGFVSCPVCRIGERKDWEGK